MCIRDSPNGYIYAWLIAYSALLGPVGGIMIADYFVLRKRRLNLAALYSEKGEYRYWKGVNPAAVAAFVIGVLPSLPGLLANIKWVNTTWIPHVLLGLYDYAWFIGFGLGFFVYIALRKLAPRPKFA